MKITKFKDGGVHFQMRDKVKEKVCLQNYRDESKKIIAILRRYADVVEKASCDEAYLDVTKKVRDRLEYADKLA